MYSLIFLNSNAGKYSFKSFRGSLKSCSENKHDEMPATTVSEGFWVNDVKLLLGFNEVNVQVMWPHEALNLEILKVQIHGLIQEIK